MTPGRFTTALHQRAYHGTPHKFDRFSLEHIGKGSGQNAFGFGIYLTGDRELARWYQTHLTDREGTWSVFHWKDGDKNGEPISTVVPEQLIPSFTGLLQENNNDCYAIQTRLKSRLHNLEKAHLEESEKYQTFYELYELVESFVEKGYTFIQNGGQLVDAEIPEPGDFLDWDKPLAGQKCAGMLGLDRKQLQDLTGKKLYYGLTETQGGAEQASAYLKSLGVPGITYQEQSLGGAQNFVVFSPDDINIQGIER